MLCPIWGFRFWDPRQSAHGRFVPVEPATPTVGVGTPGYGLKNPRGPITPKRMGNGQYLMLFYNDDGSSGIFPAESRNPYWLTCGVEVEGHGILWSQPEVALYDRYNHGKEAGGYPDFIESAETGAIYITETQKTTARIHKIDESLLGALFGQHNASALASHPVAIFGPKSPSVPAPAFASIYQWTHAGQGFSISLVLAGHGAARPAEAVLDARNADGAGVAVLVGAGGSIELHLQDATVASLNGVYRTDPLCTAALAAPGDHFVGLVVDAGPMIVSFVVDGLLCDGGHSPKAAGWSWLEPIRSLQGATTMAVGRCQPGPHCADYAGTVVAGRVYERALYTSDLVGDYRGMIAGEGCQEC